MVGRLKVEAIRVTDGGVEDATSMQNLENILDPATEYESNQWDLNLVKDHYAKPISGNYKDIYGIYYSFGGGTTRTSTNM